MMTPCLLLSLAVLVVMVEGQRRIGDDNLPECRFSPTRRTEEEEERRNSICPRRAVCGDVWNTVRDWYNGTRCREHRVTQNCRCSGGSQCPFDNPDHVFYANEKHSRYLCEPTCDLPMCLRTSPAEELVHPTRRRRGGYRYYRINCRCRDHHSPLRSRSHRGQLNRATKYSRLYFDRANRVLSTQFKCVRTVVEQQDPCQ